MFLKIRLLLTPDESNSSSLPPGENVSGENQIPPVPAPAPVPPAPPAGAKPQAANLVVNGVVKSEREIEIDRRESAAAERERLARETETTISERERKLQEREDALRAGPVTRPVKVKRSVLLPTMFDTDDDE